jgi:ATP-dependent DNA helicase RecG
VANGVTSDANGVTSDANGATSDANYDIESDSIPKVLREKINNLGKRVSRATINSIIIELCQIQPRTKEELASILGKTENHIKNNLLPELLKSHSIRFTFPEMKNHPNQKYTATK